MQPATSSRAELTQSAESKEGAWVSTSTAVIAHSTPPTAPLNVRAHGGMLMLLVAFFALPAFAEPHRVTAMVFGDDARRTAFVDSLTELLSRLQVTLDVRDTRSDAPALANLEADFSASDECRLTITDARGKVVLLRRFARAASATLQAEAAAHVAQSVIDELLQPPPVEQPLPAPPVVVAPVPIAPPSFALDFAAFFGARAFGGGAPVVIGGGLAITAALPAIGLRPSLTLLADGNAPFESADEWVTLKTQSVSPRLLLGLSPIRGDTVRLDVAFGAGADVFLSSISSSQLSTNRLHEQDPEASPIITARVALHLALTQRIDLFAAFSLDGDLHSPRFVVETGRDRETLYAPWRVRPSLSLGVSFNALGGTR